MPKLLPDLVVQGTFPYLDAPDSDLWTFFEKAIEKYHSLIALEDKTEGISLTYKDVEEKTKVIAGNLLSHGYDKSRPLCVCMINSVEFILITLAVWRLGGHVTFITPALIADEIKNQILCTEPEFACCDVTTACKIVQILSLCSLKKIFSKEKADGCILFSELYDASKALPLPIINETTAESTGLIPFSSGTTGLPKAVDIQHKTFVKQAYYFSHIDPILKNPTDCIVYQPLAHVYGFLVFMSYFYHGRKIIIMPTFNLEEYFALIASQKIEVVFVTPPIVVLFCKSGLIDRYDLSHMTDIISAAAPLSGELEQELAQLIGAKTKISQLHGMTEGGVTIAPYDSQYSYPKGSVGCILGDSMLKVIDVKTGENLGPNKQGEICLKAKHFMKGYYKNPKATNLTIDKEGWLHTGDLGYYDEQMCLFFIDRIKELIKYDFYQIAPSELESILLTHPAVADAAVTSVPCPEHGELPIAWLVPKANVKATAEDIHTYVNERVAPFKQLRGGITFVEEIPKSKTGKILRMQIRANVRAALN